jgi:UDPglucose--hexose-1-phosphate uridylyltransferase
MLVALSRAHRPHDVARGRPAPPPRGAVPEGPVPGCPFCPGAEAATPPESWSLRATGAPDAPGWRVRAFPNLYPAVPSGAGVHEVVVTSPRHVVEVGDLTDAEATDAVDAWAARARAVEGDPRGLWPFVFLNQGAPAGASLQHSHAQVVGLPFAPPRLVARARAFIGAAHCPICEELADLGDREVLRSGGLVAWFPRVPSLSGSMRVAPAEHLPDWDAAPGAALGPVLRRLAGAIGRAAPTEALNLWVHRPPPGGMDAYHWHTEIVARLGTLAGLELGAGVLALTRDPSEMAARVREELAAVG